MQKALLLHLRVVLITVIFLSIGILKPNAQTICIQAGADQIKGEKDGYGYELWNQDSQGEACMTIGNGALFNGEWSGIQNYLARRGLNYDQTMLHQSIGTFYATYNCDYNPSSSSGNSYLSIYGWTVDPLIEFYVIEDWRNWIPSMAEGATSKGSITVNGSTYDIYENTRVDKPSIVGTATFQQYFSIRRDERNSGIINISDHFNKWESIGMYLGKMHEVSFVVEGYQSSGSFEFTELDVLVSNEPLNTKRTTTNANVKVYPNPSSGQVSIRLDESVETVSLKIYNTTGELVYSQDNIYDTTVQLTNLESGIYIVNVNSSSINYNTKLMVN